jgi:hypothetical protein
LILAAPFPNVRAVKADPSIGMAARGTSLKYFVALALALTLSYTISIVLVVVSNRRDDSVYRLYEVLDSGFVPRPQIPDLHSRDETWTSQRVWLSIQPSTINISVAGGPEEQSKGFPNH